MAKSGVTDLNGQQSITGPVEVVQPDGSLLHVTVDAGTITIQEPLDVNVLSSALPTGAATEAKQDTGNASLASIDSKLTSPIAVIGPLTDAQLRASVVPVSLTSTTITGSVAVTGPLTDAQLRATPVPISGTVTATGPLTDTELRASPVPVTASISGTPNVTVTNGAGASAVNIQDGGNSITVDGTVSISGSVAVTGPLTDAQLRATPVDVNVTSVVASSVTVTNAGGASAVNIQDGGNSITVDATNLDIRDLTFASDKVDASGSSVSVSNFPATQPVSGTITANQGTSPWVVSGTVTAEQTTHDDLNANANIQIANTDVSNSNPVPVSDAGGSITVDGTVTANQGGSWTVTATQATGTNLHTVVDSGSITVNNAAGASAVNIQDGGNSITVDGPLTDAQLRATPVPVSGTITVTPSGTQDTNLIQIGGNTVNVGSGAASTGTQRVILATDQPVIPISDNGGSITVDGTVSSTQSGTWSVRLQDGSGNTLGSNTSTPSLSDRALPTRPIPFEPQRYMAATNGFAVAASATDIFRIVGSGTKTVRVRRLIVAGRTTSGSPVPVVIKLLKYSTTNTGGTSVTTTVVPIDSTNAAGTATVNHYTANPTVGTLVGNLDTRSITFQSAGLSPSGELIFNYSENPIVLRGTSQQLSINFNGTSVTGSSITCTVEWEEV